MNDLTVIPQETALAVFTTPSALDPYLQRIRDEIDAFTPDVSSKKGRDAIASIAYKVAKSKTYLDGVGKELADVQKEIPKKIDAARKYVRDTLDSWKDEVRRPLTEWEQAEEARVARHKANIGRMTFLTSDMANLNAAELTNCIAEVKDVELGEHWEEFQTSAAETKDKVLGQLWNALEVRQKYEAEQAELARLRQEAAEREQKEREARIAREAEEKAKREAEAKAAAERLAAERRELELTLQKEQAERAAEQAQRDAEMAEQRAQQAAEEARQREIKRQADEAVAVEAEAKKREKDKAHKANINNAALAAFMAGGMTEECAKLAVTLIAKKAIPNVIISY